MATYYFVQGRTDPIDMIVTLTDPDGVEVNTSFAGFTVLLLATDRAGNAISMPGTTTIQDAANRQVRYTPAATTDLLASNSPMFIRWRITDGSGKITHAPSGGDLGRPDKWVIALP